MIPSPESRWAAPHIPLDREGPAALAVFERPMERFGNLQDSAKASAERDLHSKRSSTKATGNVTAPRRMLGLGSGSHLYRKNESARDCGEE